MGKAEATTFHVVAYPLLPISTSPKSLPELSLGTEEVTDQQRGCQGSRRGHKLSFLTHASPQDAICLATHGSHHPPPLEEKCHLAAWSAGVLWVPWAHADIPADQLELQAQEGRYSAPSLGLQEPCSHLWTCVLPGSGV